MFDDLERKNEFNGDQAIHRLRVSSGLIPTQLVAKTVPRGLLLLTLRGNEDVPFNDVIDSCTLCL